MLAMCDERDKEDFGPTGLFESGNSDRFILFAMFSGVVPRKMDLENLFEQNRIRSFPPIFSTYS